jgi:hypothetical protein
MICLLHELPFLIPFATNCGHGIPILQESQYTPYGCPLLNTLQQTIPLFPSQNKRLPSSENRQSPPTITKWVSTKWASALVTSRKPLEQASRMEQIFTSLTSLVRHLLITTDNRVANCTFCLSFQGEGNVLLESGKTTGNVVVLY